MDALHRYIVGHNPELLLRLEEGFSLTDYLEAKAAAVLPLINQWTAEGQAAYLIEERCLQEMTAELRPSRFLYLKELLEEEFIAEYTALRESGTLTYELVNLLNKAAPVFEELGFSQATEDDRLTRYAIIGIVQEYLSLQKGIS